MLRIALIYALFTVTTAAMAGATAPHAQVYINSGIKYAAGSMIGARESPDDMQLFRCATRNYVYQIPEYGISLPAVVGTCDARNASGEYVSCVTQHWLDAVSSDASNVIAGDMIRAIRSIDAESSIVFQWDDAGICTSIVVENSSVYKN